MGHVRVQPHLRNLFEPPHPGKLFVFRPPSPEGRPYSIFLTFYVVTYVVQASLIEQSRELRVSNQRGSGSLNDSWVLLSELQTVVK